MKKRMFIRIALASMLIQGMPVQNVYAEGMGDPNDVETPEDIEQDEPELYSLVLNNAVITDSSGNVIETRDFEEGTEIHLEYIPEDSERDEFIRWTVVTDSGSQVEVNGNSFWMPAENVSVEAGFDRYYRISVSGGKSDKQKALAGETVSITSNKINDNEAFQGWTVENGNAVFADAKNASTTFVMPEEDVTVKGQIGLANGFKVIGGKTYYYTNGNKATGWKKVSGKWYYFDASGIMQTGWKKISNKWYYMDAKGIMQTGWVTVSGKKYYFDASGVMQTGWKKLSNKWYYLNSSGAMVTGWQKLSNKWYYFDNSGVMATGWKKISNKWYFFNSSGAMLTGWQKISNKWYYLNSSGAMQTGWKKIGNTWYYFKDSGAMVTGWNAIAGKWYYMNGSGAMLTGWQKIGGKYYYFNGSGVMLTGWQKLSSKWYYFKDSGAMVTGWNAIDGHWYYMNTTGAMLTGWQTIGGKQYYFKSSGVMAADEWVDGNYLTSSGAKQAKTSSNANDVSGPFILNVKSHTVHIRNCGHLPTKNGRSTNESLDTILSWGYKICGWCQN